MIRLLYSLDWKNAYTVYLVQNGHSKICATKILMTNGSFMKEKKQNAALCNTFDQHYAIVGLEKQFAVS